MASKAKRVVMYSRGDGRVGFKVQGSNWSTIDSGDGASVGAVRAKLRRAYPGVEIHDRCVST